MHSLLVGLIWEFVAIWYPSYLLLFVWHAPLGVRSAKRRHQSPEWTILSHSYCLIQWEIVGPQVLLDSLHPCSTRTSWWSPVLRRGSSYDTPGICFVRHSRNVAEQRKTMCSDNSRQYHRMNRVNSCNGLAMTTVVQTLPLVLFWSFC